MQFIAPNRSKKMLDINEIAKEVFLIESQEIASLSSKLDENFENSVKSILTSRGKVILSGMGKSGIIAKKIAGKTTPLRY